MTAPRTLDTWTTRRKRWALAIVQELATLPGTNRAVLADAIGVGRTTCREILGELARAGLVDGQPIRGPAHRPWNGWRLTDAGRALVAGSGQEERSR